MATKDGVERMKITKTDSKTITEIVAAANIYRPTPDQRRIKAEYHASLANGPTPSVITAAFAVQLTGHGVVEKWWSVVGFRSWFLDAVSFENEAEALANAALGIIGDIMYSGEKASDRLAASKLMVEIAGKVKKAKVETRFLDESIPDDPKLLDEYIAKASGRTKDPSCE